ncbi:MAG: hypothetical protein JJT94_07775 [Bernardetiaceae bacterium]|nr:hypothetical protein [Bernardetiaceae bacterium]
MQEPSFIQSTPEEEEISLNFRQLYEEGLREAQHFSGENWTDYNIHDPGVTILEQLCYALTEMAYRAKFEVADFLTDPKTQKINPQRQSLYTADEIFVSNALTIEDYRKLIFDRVFEVLNVWIEPVIQEGHTLQGLYKVYLHLNELVDTPEQKQQVKERVRKVYAAHRNLCEDIQEIIILEPFKVRLQGDIYLNENYDPEEVLAEVFFRVNKHLAPEIRFYALEEMKKEGASLEQIFSGPALKHGFIKSEELEERPRNILISDITRIIMDVKGVGSVQNLTFYAKGKVHAEQMPISINTIPMLDTEPDTRGRHAMHIHRNNITFKVDNATIQADFNALRTASRRIYRLTHGEIELPKGQKRDFKNYYSIQEDFPLNYGISSQGLSHKASPQRKAQAKQLKAYLMFFEQLMTNYLAQLEGVRELYSVSTKLNKTYFYQPLDTVPNSEELFAKSDVTEVSLLSKNGTIPHHYKKGLAPVNTQYDDYADRRNRFLNYLLAIYGESFAQYSISKFNKYFDQDDYQHALIANKIRFLNHITQISKNRAKAFDYTETIDNPLNVSGLELKICILLELGLLNRERSAPITHLNESLLDAFENRAMRLIGNYIVDPVVGIIRNENINNAYIENNFEYVDEDEQHEFSDKQIDALLRKTLPFRMETIDEYYLRKGIDMEYYKIGQDPDNKDLYYAVYKAEEDSAWRKIGEFANRAEAVMGIKELVEFVRELNVRSEGVHVLEHFLLRPNFEENRFNFEVCNRKGERQLIPKEAMTFEARNALLQQIKQGLAKNENYSINETLDFKYRLLFTYEAQQLFGLKEFATEAEALKEIANLTDYFTITEEQAFQTAHEGIRLLVRIDEKTTVPEQFFSFQMSFVFPTWTARFHDREFRLLVKETLARNTPAHLQSHCYWLKPDDMRRFESAFFKWLHEKTLTKPNLNRLYKLQNRLLKFLLEYEQKDYQNPAVIR